MEYPKITDFKYPHIENLYNIVDDDDLWSCECVAIQEKIHGTQTRILVSKASVQVGTRNRKLESSTYGYPYQYDMGMNCGITLREHLLANSEILGSNSIMLFCEFFGQGVQKGIYYGDKRDIRVFDIVLIDLETGEQSWLDATEVLQFCNTWGIESVPLMYTGKPTREVFDSLFAINSTIVSIEDNTLEGIVIKSVPVAFYYDGTPVYTKHKNDKWSEKVESKRAKTHNHKQITFYDFITPARIVHAVEHLRERGDYDGRMSDVPKVINEVIADIQDEESATDVPYKEKARQIAILFKQMLKEGQLL